MARIKGHVTGPLAVRLEQAATGVPADLTHEDLHPLAKGVILPTLFMPWGWGL